MGEVSISDIVEDISSGDCSCAINLDASQEDDNIYTIHCWNGERYLLTLTRLTDGCGYDPDTGAKIAPTTISYHATKRV
jgi:hypothetical protein